MAVADTRDGTADSQPRPGAQGPGAVGLASMPGLRFVLILVGVAALAALFMTLLWFAADVLLLAFAGIILAIFLRRLSSLLAEHTRLSRGWALALVVVAFVALAGLIAWLLSGHVIREADQLAEDVPRSLRRLETNLQQSDAGRLLLRRIDQARARVVTGGNVVTTATNVVTTSFAVLIKAVLVVLIGIYGAATPEVYFNGFVRLVPFSRRRRVRDALAAVDYTLWRWVLCRLISMAWVGLTTMVALYLLHVPLALTLGLIAGLLKFVPYIGPIVSVVPAALLAVLQGPMKVLWVVLLYFALEMIDDHVIMPLLNWREIWLPPALGIFAQVLFGALWGVLGVLFAMPAAAALLVLVKMLYLEDTLGGSAEVPQPADTAA